VFIDIVENEEECLLSDCNIKSKLFDYNGGELLIKEHSVKITVPNEAINKGHKMQIQAAASLFGPFIIPNGYHTISPNVWIGACFEYINKPLEVEIEHDVVCEKINSSELCMLTTSEKDIYGEKDGQKMFKMNEDTVEYQFQISDTTCTFFSDHFCSKRLAIKTNEKIPKRIIMYHYLPENYKYSKEFVAEVCFCQDLTDCKKVIFLAEYE